LSSDSTGDNNTATGSGALAANSTGSRNAAHGAFALNANTTGFDNTATGFSSLTSNTTGNYNTAHGAGALGSNTTGQFNTAVGTNALSGNVIRSSNTAIGFGADVSAGNLANATAIGAGAVVNASNKIRLGSVNVMVIEGQVAFTAVSDKTKKENFKPVDGEEVLRKISGFELTSWNFIGHDPKEFRHYGPMAQDFFAAFGHDDIGKIGTETTINSGDIAGILMIAVQALEKRTEQISSLQSELKQKDEQIATLATRLDVLELRQNQSIQITAEQR